MDNSPAIAPSVVATDGRYASFQTISAPPPVSAPSAAATRELPTPGMAASVAAVTTSSATTPVMSAAEVRGAAAIEGRRSWWEHWSSGIVLILLIIALVTASIIAMNDSRKSSADRLASTTPQPAADEFDLINIQIPDIEPHAQPVAGASSAAPHAPSLVTDSARQGSAQQGSARPTVSSTFTAKEFKATEAAASEVAKPEAIESSNRGELELAGSSEQAAKTQSTTSNAPPRTESAPLATLSIPVGVQTRGLFAEPAFPSGEKTTASVPSLTASGPTGPPVPAAGSSPAFYDGAAKKGLPEATAFESSKSTEFPADTHMQEYSALLSGKASATAEFSTASHRSGRANFAPSSDSPGSNAAGSSASASAPATESAQVAQALPANSFVPNPIPSATPEMNAEAIVNAYLMFKSPSAIQNAPPANRYPPSTTYPSSALPRSSGTGFTLGSPNNGNSAGFIPPGN